MKIEDQVEILTFQVTRVARYDMILGKSWLSKHDPKIKWSSNELAFSSRLYRQNRLTKSHFQAKPCDRPLRTPFLPSKNDTSAGPKQASPVPRPPSLSTNSSSRALFLPSHPSFVTADSRLPAVILPIFISTFIGASPHTLVYFSDLIYCQPNLHLRIYEVYHLGLFLNHSVLSYGAMTLVYISFKFQNSNSTFPNSIPLNLFSLNPPFYTSLHNKIFQSLDPYPQP